MWGLDAIKTKGESVAMALALVGATRVEGTGRGARFELIPLEELGRPRVDVVATLSGIFGTPSRMSCYCWTTSSSVLPRPTSLSR